MVTWVFVNWLTIVPSLMSFDDKSLAFLFSSSSAKNDVIKIQQFQKAGAGPRPTWGTEFHFILPN